MMKESQLSPVADGARCNNADFDFERRKRESSCLQLDSLPLSSLQFPWEKGREGRGVYPLLQNVTNELQPTYLPSYRILLQLLLFVLDCLLGTKVALA